MADNKLLLKLAQNLLESLDDDEYYDITIEVGKDPYVKVFRAHMVILYYRSPYLRRVLSTNKKGNDGTLAHIKLPNIFPETFNIILKYIYGGKLPLEEYDTLDVIDILVAASELSLQELVIHIQSFLIKNEANWIEKNFNRIYQTSFEHDSFSELQKFCTDLISKEPEKIFKLVDFVSIPEKSLISLIQNDNLPISDVQVWEHVLKWGIAQNPELPSDPSNYSKNDFNTLKNTLQQCIPFIRFYNLTSKEFLNKVLPYRKALPKELYLNLVKCFLNNDYKPSDDFKLKFKETLEIKSEPQIIKETREIQPRNIMNIDSKIITDQHAELISKWINRIDSKDELKTPYIYKLLLRGSRDGFTCNKFHEICDNQTRTVIITKVENSKEILGGYNPITWKRDQIEYGNTKESFIFSFKDKENIENHILSRVKDNEFAINYNFSRPSFGCCHSIFDDPDLSIGVSYICCKKNSYEKAIRETGNMFSIEEYEVFQIKI